MKISGECKDKPVFLKKVKTIDGFQQLNIPYIDVPSDCILETKVKIRQFKNHSNQLS